MAQLSARYAAALFDIAMESGVPEEYRDQAVFLRDTLSGKECLRMTLHPQISAAQKHEFLESVFKGNIHDDLLGFLYMAIAKNRESFIVPGLSAFIKRMDEHFGRVKANVVSAHPLSESQISALREMLSKKLNKHVEISAKVDPALIGGLTIHMDGYYIDRTIKKRLDDMKISLKRGTVNDSQAG